MYTNKARDNCVTKRHCQTDSDCPESEYCWTQTPCDYHAMINGGSVTAKPSEPLQEHPESSASEMVSDVLAHAASESKGGGEGNAYLDMVNRYHPTWYSRSEDGYDGTTYDEALIYCAQRSMMIPCVSFF